MSDLEQRLVDLERRVRNLENPQEIRIQSQSSEMVLRANGTVIYTGSTATAALIITGNGPMLTLYSSSGQPAVGMDVVQDSAALRLFDSEGRPKAEIQVVEGMPELILFDDNGTRRIEADCFGSTNLTLNDGSGKVRVQLSVTEEGKVVTRWE